MAQRPILLFPSATVGPRVKRKSGFPQVSLPDVGQQRSRITPQLSRLARALETQSATLQASVAGALPEQVVVLETVGAVDQFARAVRRVEGLEWLVEWDADEEADDEAGDDEAEDEEAEDLVGERLFLVMSNQVAMRQVLTLWAQYQADPRAAFPYGLGQLKQVFKQLTGVRAWDATDRVALTGLSEYLDDYYGDDAQLVRIEVELWFRDSEAQRGRATAAISSLVGEVGGRVIASAVIADIRYHGMLVDLPVSAAKRMVEQKDTRLVLCNDVMFFRPTSQFAVVSPVTEEPAASGLDGAATAPSDPPLVAILDGFPLAAHQALQGYVDVDDPDGWEQSYPVEARVHGTAMASLVIRGDMHTSGAPLPSRVYMRPVMKPEPGWADTIREAIPADVLPVDLIHRAVRRMFDGDSGQSGAAPTVRIINFSIGDLGRVFARDLSPLARLLDWLSHKYGVLFVVSSGNHVDSIELDVPAGSFQSLPQPERQRKLVQAVMQDAARRRLLSPAESVNALTVGGWSLDKAIIPAPPSIWHPYAAGSGLLLTNALGLGYARAVKPDVLVDGGRLHYRESVRPGPNVVLSPVISGVAPGQRVAVPGHGGNLAATANICGSSNSAALATRALVGIYTTVQELRNGVDSGLLPEACTPALLKALLVHAARWGEAKGELEAALAGSVDRRQLRDVLTRMLGYGYVDLLRVGTAADERAVLLGAGVIRKDEAHAFRVPLPPSLAAKKVWRRLTVTLAWISPVNCSARSYREARLHIEPPKRDLLLDRSDAQWQAVRRGTVQHEILEGDRAVAFADGDSLGITVTCRGGRMLGKDSVPFAIVASVEVPEAVGIPVYNEIQARLRVPVPVRPVAAATA